MKKAIIKKTLNEIVYWLYLVVDGENEDYFVQITRSFYTRCKEGHKIFLDCCLSNKFISEDLDEKCNRKIYTKMQFGTSKMQDFQKMMKQLDEEEKEIQEKINFKNKHLEKDDPEEKKKTDSKSIYFS